MYLNTDKHCIYIYFSYETILLNEIGDKLYIHNLHAIHNINKIDYIHNIHTIHLHNIHTIHNINHDVHNIIYIYIY